MKSRKRVLVCAGTGCLSCGCRAVRDALMGEVIDLGVASEIEIVETGCFGACDLGPVVIVGQEQVLYPRLTPEGAKEVARRHLAKDEPVDDLLYRDNRTGETLRTLPEIPFFVRQTKVVRRNCGEIDPLSLNDYISRDGYRGLEKALKEMTPAEVIQMINSSGLRGRGGGGFATGVKWDLAASSSEATKFVVCNADEGDPGAFMDRSQLEGDPHSVIEGLTIAGYAIGARRGFVYVRAEYRLAVERLQAAIQAARARGLLGKAIFGSGFDFDVEMRVGAGAFVCGEETALLASVEGRRGTPNPRPPYPAERGLWGKPTIINNVKTLATVPVIILRGADWFRSLGTEQSKGTMVFALAGKINNTGLAEVPMGTTLREIIYDIGGGIPDGQAFKAAQTGGPSGGCIPVDYLDVPVEYDTLTRLGSMMGSGGLIVMDEATCMVDVAKFFLEFTKDESCGKCIPCREGCLQMLEMLERITSGAGRAEDIGLLEELADVMKSSALCGLGQTAPNPVLSTLRYFRSEYEAHIHEKTCPAGVCQALRRFVVFAERCRGCGVCKRVCPAGAISGEPKTVHSIDQDLCLKCSACVNKCRFEAIHRA